MHRNRSAQTHDFAMVPRAEIPRSSFRIQKGYKTTFNSGVLIPVHVDEVLPGDTFNLKMTAFARMATPIFPVMDNLYLDSFFFFVPCRLVWSNWVKMMGEQDNPADSISYTVPQMGSTVGGYAVGSLADYFGLPTVGQVQAGLTVAHSSLPFRAYNLIWNQWFRDENLQNSAFLALGDGPDTSTNFPLQRRGKRPDYFTSCLPFVQKGPSVALPLGTSAPVFGTGHTLYPANPITVEWYQATDQADKQLAVTSGSAAINLASASAGTGSLVFSGVRQPLYADLTAATAATINQLRQAFQIQKLLERDARGGTRYTEIVRSHFGVISPDARLQRAEYLGGGSVAIQISPVAQTSGTAATGTTTPLGNLAAIGQTVAHQHGFSQSFTEHGYVIGLVSVRADLTYQQGMRKMWSRTTRYDFYFPVFAALGEQAVLNKEIYCDGSATDTAVFGYQERWGEYRYNPSQITGLFRSTSAGTLDPWHLAQRFGSLPTLNSAFIAETPPIQRVVAVGAGANGAEFLLDAFFDIKAARPMPMYSVPGMIDHF